MRPQIYLNKSARVRLATGPNWAVQAVQQKAT
jgi:hypothetical protein